MRKTESSPTTLDGYLFGLKEAGFIVDAGLDGDLVRIRARKGTTQDATRETYSFALNRGPIKEAMHELWHFSHPDDDKLAGHSGINEIYYEAVAGIVITNIKMVYWCQLFEQIPEALIIHRTERESAANTHRALRENKLKRELLTNREGLDANQLVTYRRRKCAQQDSDEGSLQLKRITMRWFNGSTLERKLNVIDAETNGRLQRGAMFYEYLLPYEEAEAHAWIPLNNFHLEFSSTNHPFQVDIRLRRHATDGKKGSYDLRVINDKSTESLVCPRYLSKEKVADVVSALKSGVVGNAPPLFKYSSKIAWP